MNKIYFLILIPISIYFINSYIYRKGLIPNFSGNNHQKIFNNTKIPLSGGIFLLIVILYIFFNEPFIFKITITAIFIIGFFSDINIFSSVKLRFLLQSFVVFYFIYFTKLNIGSIRIEFIDLYLQNFVINAIFTSFCLIILINGSNFIDGLNGLIISYNLLIIFILTKLNIFDFFISDLNLMIFFITIISLLIFNLNNKLYMGDSGSYLLGFLTGYLVILTYSKNPLISPYFIVVLLWYPAFEILFSILRKLKSNKSPIKPDNNHLHHLLFFFIEKKFKQKKNITNNISSIIIILYNFVVFNISLLNVYFTYLHVTLIFINLSIYLITYLKLDEFKKIRS